MASQCRAADLEKQEAQEREEILACKPGYKVSYNTLSVSWSKHRENSRITTTVHGILRRYNSAGNLTQARIATSARPWLV